MIILFCTVQSEDYKLFAGGE